MFDFKDTIKFLQQWLDKNGTIAENDTAKLSQFMEEFGDYGDYMEDYNVIINHLICTT